MTQNKKITIIPVNLDPNSKAIELQLAALQSPDVEVREIAAQALRGVASPAVREALAHALFDRSHLVRLAAAKALVHVHDGEEFAFEGLLNGLNDWDSKVREACAKALYGTTQPHAVKALYDGLNDEDRAVRLACSHALEEARKVA
jgi:HEAT repeat protein